MKETIIELLGQALETLKADGTLPADASPQIKVDPTKDKSHGDYASNLAMMTSKAAGMKPRDLAEKLIAALPAARPDGVLSAMPSATMMAMAYRTGRATSRTASRTRRAAGVRWGASSAPAGWGGSSSAGPPAGAA